MVVEVIDAPWAGVPVRIRWLKRRWICRTTWNPCGPISSRVCKPHLMPLPVFAGVRVLGVDERCVASPGPTSTGPRELTGIVDLT